MKQPLVSILIAVRNEEKNLSRLLFHLENLDYPKDRLEVFIANDESTDNTWAVLSAFAAGKPWLQAINLEDIQVKNDFPKGKMRALAAIENQATGDYLLFTDADIALPPTWVHGMLAGFTGNVGVLNGITGVKNTGFMARMQNIEWLMALYVMHINAGWGLPSTGMGNNLGISRAAFDAVGGYNGIGFSIVEDYAIYKAILAKGFGFNHLFNTDVLAETLEAENYLEQRRRWMKGAFSSDSYLLYLMIAQAFSLPFLIIIAFFSPLWAVGLFMIQIGINSYLALKIKYKLNLKMPLLDILAFVFYISLSALVQLIYYFLGKKIIWKERTYIK